ncbi:MAG: AAA family ATPase [Myxococcota bacterium]
MAESKHEQHSDAQRVAYLRALCRTVPLHIVEAVLAQPSERSITDQQFDGALLLADVVGFTELCDQLAASGPPGLSRLSQILSDLFAYILEEAMFPYGGYVVRFSGDAIAVAFRGNDYALRAAACALTCQRIMHGESGRLLEGRSGELMLRIGVAEGPIALRVLGDLIRREVVCGGPTAYRALALKDSAQPKSVVGDIALIDSLHGNIEVVARSDQGAVVRGLRRWPQGGRLADFDPAKNGMVDEKIALLEPFVSAPLALRLRTMPQGWQLEGELREVVVVNAELEVSPVAQTDARLGQISQDIACSLLRAFRKFGGMVARVELTNGGHRVLILFGLHRPADNDEERALLAALEGSARINGIVAAGDIGIVLRTAVHKGQIYFGAVGSIEKHDITVVGDAVGVAGRIAAQANPFETLASGVVLEGMSNEFRLSTREALVNSAAETFPIFAVEGAVEGQAHSMRSRRKARFRVGREREVAALSRAVDESLAGRGQVVGFCGAAGTGKSFLLSHAIDRWLENQANGAFGRCRYATRSVPLAPVVAMFGNFLGLSHHDSEEERRERIRSGFRPFALERDAPELVALLQPVLRADGTTEATVDLVDAHAREHVLGSIIEFLGKRVETEPMLYVLEDLHYADTLTLELCQRLSTLSRHRPFMFLGTYRPDPVLRDLRRGFDGEITLGNLTLHDASRLIAKDQGATQVDADLALFVWERSRGRPGDMNDILGFLTDRDLIRTHADKVAPSSGSIERLQDAVPRGLAQMALARLDALGTIERRVLRVASVMGQRFHADLLAKVLQSQMDPAQVEGAMAALEGKRIVVTQDNDASDYMFRNGEVRAVAYGTIPEAEQQQLHASIADVLEDLPPNDARRISSQLAFHRDRALQWEAAALWYKDAVQIAMRSGLDRESCELVDSWFRVVKKIPPYLSPEFNEFAQMSVARFVAIARQGNPARTVRSGRQLTAEYGARLPHRLHSVVDYWLGHALMLFGHPARARLRLHRVVNSEAPTHQRSDAARLMAQTYAMAHEHDLAKSWAKRARNLLGNDIYRLARIDLLEADIQVDQGEFAQARENLGRLLKDSRRSDQYDARRTNRYAIGPHGDALSQL